MKQLIEVPTSNDPDTLFEIILLSSVVGRSEELASAKTVLLEVEPVVVKANKPVKEAEPIVEPAIGISAEQNAPKAVGRAKLKIDLWPEVLDAIRSKHNTLYGVARMAVPTINKDTLTLTTKFQFHEKTLREEKNKKIISDIIYGMTGKQINIILIVDKKLELSNETEDKQEDENSLSAINNIFGSTEVLE